jgi:hypothetical protein
MGDREWNDGIMRILPVPGIPIFQYSNIPTFHIPADFNLRRNFLWKAPI